MPVFGMADFLLMTSTSFNGTTKPIAANLGASSISYLHPPLFDACTLATSLPLPFSYEMLAFVFFGIDTLVFFFFYLSDLCFRGCRS